MASLTLAEAAKLQQNPLIQGVIESIVTTNQIYDVFPFQTIAGNSIAFNRELALGDADFVGIGSTPANAPPNAITAKSPTTVAPDSARLVAIIGDAEVDHFEMTTMTNPNDQQAIQIAGKAKSIGRKFQDTLINGNISVLPNSFDGLKRKVPAAQKFGVAGQAYSFEVLDGLIDLIKSKDGQVDYFMMNSRHIRQHLRLLRALGGANITEVMTLPGGGTIMSYRGIPIFRNDWVAVTNTPAVSGPPAVPESNTADIYAGVWDDGSKKVGLSGITSENQSGIFVTNVGEKEETNDVITRLRFYCGLALYSELGIAMAPEVDDAVLP